MKPLLAQQLRFKYGHLASAAPVQPERMQVATTGKSDLHVLALVKGDERYVFLFDEFHIDEMLRTLARFASHLELNFSWYDCAHLSQKVRARTINDDCGGR